MAWSDSEVAVARTYILVCMYNDRQTCKQIYVPEVSQDRRANVNVCTFTNFLSFFIPLVVALGEILQ